MTLHEFFEVERWVQDADKLLINLRFSRFDVMRIIMHESGGDAFAVNHTDINAKEGHPSKGLMQLIDSTFTEHRLPQHNSARIFDPVANICAGIRYAISRYGSVSSVPGIIALNQGKSYVGY